MTLTRSPIKRDPEAARAWEKRSREKARERAREAPPREAIGERKGPQRRVEHPFPLPTGEPVKAADVREPGVAFGAQAALCRATMCAACFAASWRRIHGAMVSSDMVPPIDWTLLPAADGERSEAHHEPPRGTAVASDDDDTLPLCRRHHGRKGEPARRFAVRHSPRFEHNPAEFYIAANIGSFEAVRDEMRRRTAAQISPPIPGAEGDPWGHRP